MQITTAFPTLYQDPIIEAMLASRPKSFKGVSQSDELERKNRMAGMLKASKKYKRMATENANQKWQSLSNGSDMISISDVSSTTTQSSDIRRPRRVSFSETIDFIPVDYRTENGIKGISVVKAFFSSLLTSRCK